VCDGVVDSMDVIDGSWGDVKSLYFGDVQGGPNPADTPFHRLFTPPSGLLVVSSSASLMSLWAVDLKVGVIIGGRPAQGDLCDCFVA
jgi:hypothetical protein